MDASTKRLLWIAGGAAAVAVIARASYMAGRRQAKLYAAPAPTSTATVLTPISVPGVDTLNQGSPGPLVTVILAGASVPANVPKGGRLEIYPPDVMSRILSYTEANGAGSGAPASPAGPLVVAPVNGTGTLNVTWQDAGGAPHVTAVNIAAV